MATPILPVIRLAFLLLALVGISGIATVWILKRFHYLSPHPIGSCVITNAHEYCWLDQTERAGLKGRHDNIKL